VSVAVVSVCIAQEGSIYTFGLPGSTPAHIHAVPVKGRAIAAKLFVDGVEHEDSDDSGK
jgi:hypothetical protein